MPDRHLIVGAGPVGTHVARLLADRGSDVAVVTRSGTQVAPSPGSSAPIASIALDASDADALSTAAEGATALYNCANPADYTKWAKLWPPLAESLATAAQRTGAVLAVAGSLYPYGPVRGGDRPWTMTEATPDAATDRKGVLRATIWADLRAQHDRGSLRAVEVRASDYVGPGVGENGLLTRVVPAALDGKTAWVFDGADHPHSFTDVLDQARALVAVADRSDLWGKVWHAPTNAPVTVRQALTDVLASVGKAPVPVRVVPRALTVPAGWVVPLLRELNDLSYQRTAPYILDSSYSETTLGLSPTPWEEVCRRTAQG